MVEGQPRVSVLVAAHNATGTLAATLDSIRNQSYTDWEAVVVDDGSIDDTMSVASRFCQEDSRFRVWHQTNQGAALARNRAAAESSAEWILPVDADDRLLPTALERQLRFMDSHPGFDLYSWGMLLLHQDGTTTRWPGSVEHERIESYTVRQLVPENLLPISTFISRAAFDRLGGFRAVHLEDYDLWIRALASGERHLHNPEYLWEYRVSTGSSKTLIWTGGLSAPRTSWEIWRTRRESTRRPAISFTGRRTSVERPR